MKTDVSQWIGNYNKNGLSCPHLTELCHWYSTFEERCINSKIAVGKGEELDLIKEEIESISRFINSL